MTRRFSFWDHFDEAFDHLKAKHNSRLSDDKILNFASEIALKLVEIDFKEKENSYSYEKAQVEIKNLVLQSRTQNEAMQLEKLKSLVQAHSMLLSVGDNAAINKANAIVSFLNVVGNASNEKMAAKYTTQVMEYINQISNKDLSREYGPLLDRIKALAGDGLSDGRAMSEVGILAPRTKLRKNEAVEVEGWSLYPQGEQYFELETKHYEGNRLFFISETSGEFELIFHAKNPRDEDLQARLKIMVD